MKPISQELVDRAVILTANCTWWLVIVTAVAALVTLLAVIAAFVVPTWRDWVSTQQQRKHQETRRTAVQANAQSAFKIMDKFEHCFVPENIRTYYNLWTYLNKIEVEISLIDYYMKLEFGDENYPHYLLIVRQSLYETRDACKMVVSGRLHDKPAEWGHAKQNVVLAKERCGEVRRLFNNMPVQRPKSNINPA